MIYGYARVSTAGQAKDGNSLSDQEKRLKQAGAEVVYSEHYTGTKMHRPAFERLVGELKEGDTLVVTKLDRFARTATEGYQTIKELMERGVSVNVLNMGMVNDSAIGRLMLQVLLAFAEFERDMIVERTQAGKEIARQREGYKEGRPGIPEDIVEKIREGVPYQELGIGKMTWYKYR